MDAVNLDPLAAVGDLAFLEALGAFPVAGATGTADPEAAGATDCAEATATRATKVKRDLNILIV